ncbi:hypothetical protein ACFLR7_01365 [Acidobacteriota bacterium]
MRKIHKITGSFLSALFLFTLIVQATPAEDLFAPKVTPPKNIENRSFWMQMIESWNIPGKSEVQVPAYPGAYVVGFMPASEMTANGVKSKTFPSIVLATSDERAKVTEFYREALKEWKYENMMDMFDIFWTGKDEFNSMDIEQATSTTNINIADAFQPHKDFMPDAKTTITIVYKPEK